MRLDVDQLTATFADLTVRDQLRSSHEVPMPNGNLVAEFERICCNILEWPYENNSVNYRKRKMISSFGVLPIVMAKAWELMMENLSTDEWPRGWRKKHLAWTYHRMHIYSNKGAMCSSMKCNSENTFRKWTDHFLKQLSSLEHHVILWDRRLIDDEGEDCKVGFDTVDFRFQQIRIPDPKRPGKTMINKALYSWKFRGPGLRYEVATSIKTSDVVWINGPFAPGDYDDLSIFRLGLKHMLQDGKRGEADDAYLAEAPSKVKCPGMFADISEEEEALRSRIGGRIETINNRVKHFGCLSKVFVGRGQDRAGQHGILFRACIISCQIAMDIGIGELYRI